MKAIQEYQALSSIKDKLNFDPSGRPGAPAIREDQERLIEKRDRLHRRVLINLGSPHIIFRRETPEQSHNRRFAQYILRQHCLALTERDEREGYPRKLLDLDLETTKPVQVGPWFVKVQTFEDKDYSYYSKSWHNRYGPKVTVTHIITFARMYRGKPKVLRHYPTALTGDYIANAAIALGIAKPVKSKHPLKLRLKKEFDVKLIGREGDNKIYSRALLGTHWDYVIQSPNGVVYHDSDKSKLLAGLQEKIEAKQAKEARKGLVTWNDCKKLGFCDAGLQTFCETFGFDPDGAYSPSEIEKRVAGNPAAATPYLDELRTLANAYNYESKYL